jgi:anti-sigma B factor antagonist
LPLARFDVRSDVLAGGRQVGVVEASGELDLATAGEFFQALRQCAEGHSAVVVDLTGISFMDCSALRALARMRRELEARGGRLCLVATKPSVLRLFGLAKMDFSLVADREQARLVLDTSSGH